MRAAKEERVFTDQEATDLKAAKANSQCETCGGTGEAKCLCCRKIESMQKFPKCDGCDKWSSFDQSCKLRRYKFYSNSAWEKIWCDSCKNVLSLPEKIPATTNKLS